MKYDENESVSFCLLSQTTFVTSSQTGNKQVLSKEEEGNEEREKLYEVG